MPDPRAKFVTLYKLSQVQKFSIFESPIMNSVCPQILHKLLFSNALRVLDTSETVENN